MPIVNFITHHITKDSSKPAAILDTMSDAVEIDDTYQQLFNKIKQIFIQRSGKRYGRFSDENLQAKGLTINWLEEKHSFVSWSKKIGQLLSEKLDNTEHEIDGYLLFAQDQLADSDKIYIAHVQEKIDFSISPEGNLQQSTVIDFSNTGFVLCIEQQELLASKVEASSEYFTFSYGRGDKPLQNILTEALGFTDTVDTEQETQEFLSIVDEYTEQIAKINEEKAQEAKNIVIDYCMQQDKNGEAVAFKELSHQLDDTAPEKFEAFVAEKRAENRQAPAYASDEDDQVVQQSPADKTEFIADRKSLKNYVRYSGRNQDLTISFSSAVLGQDVQFDAVNNTLLLTNLPSRLLNQLKPN